MSVIGKKRLNAAIRSLHAHDSYRPNLRRSDATQGMTAYANTGHSAPHLLIADASKTDVCKGTGAT